MLAGLRQNTSSLPSFAEAFGRHIGSMSTAFDENDYSLCKNANFKPILKRHPKKNALKRHLEQEKVVVKPAQPNAKKLKSEWDLLFYNHESQTYESRNNATGQSSSNGSIDPLFAANSIKSKKRQSFLVKGKEMKSFFHLLDDDIIQDFLHRDKCMRITDKYLIAMVFAYFKRAGYKIREYTRMNFFVALYLANDMEEDEEELKYEIFPWALGDRWRDKFSRFLLKRDNLWARIDHRAVVSRCCCDQIMAIEPEHPVWTRLRPDHHAGAQRGYLKGDDDDGYPRGPGASPRACQDCDTDSVYDSASPLSVSWYISSGQTSPNNEELEFFEKLPSSTFDMIGLKKTLTDNEWPAPEE